MKDRDELIRLLAVKAIWPAPIARAEFPAELHLVRAIERLYEKIYHTPPPKAYPTKDEG